MKVPTARIEERATIVEAMRTSRGSRGGECSLRREQGVSKPNPASFYLDPPATESGMERSSVRTPGSPGNACTLHALHWQPARAGEVEAEGELSYTPHLVIRQTDNGVDK